MNSFPPRPVILMEDEEKQREQGPYSRESWKPLIFQHTLVLKAAFVLCLLASLSLLFYFSSFNQSLICSDCHPKFQTTTHNNIANGEVSVTTNISHILFGIAGSTKTWTKRQKYIDLWWKPNVTRGFVWLDEKPNTTWPDTWPPYKVSEDTSRFNYTCWYGSRSAIRLARIVEESFQLGLDQVRWFVMGDDDTVFFTENLVNVLAKYDHTQMYYIGDNSESVEQDVIHSYKVAYGGGGYAISYPLAAELVRVLDGCLDRYASLYGGDQKVQACMSEIGVPLTVELGFHQADIQGSAYGFLAAHPIAQLVSLHHVDYLPPIFPSMNQVDSLRALISAYRTDPGRTLQHSFCYDLSRNWTVSVAWGYSIQLHPSFVTAKQMDTVFQTFQTWKSYSDGPFTFDSKTVGPDPCDKPVLYFLDRVDQRAGLDQGSTLTSYKKYTDVWEKECSGDDYQSASTVQYFNVSASILNPVVWTKAPRRQCCEVMNGTDGTGSAVHVEIRGCNRFETVTPP